jgi:hypothetical protein
MTLKVEKNRDRKLVLCRYVEGDVAEGDFFKGLKGVRYLLSECRDLSEGIG